MPVKTIARPASSAASITFGLGTVLVEHGFVDIEAVTIYLGLELGIPIATGAMLERAKRAAVRLLQPAQAFKHKCVPLVVQEEDRAALRACHGSRVSPLRYPAPCPRRAIRSVRADPARRWHR